MATAKFTYSCLNVLWHKIPKNWFSVLLSGVDLHVLSGTVRGWKTRFKLAVWTKSFSLSVIKLVPRKVILTDLIRAPLRLYYLGHRCSVLCNLHCSTAGKSTVSLEKYFSKLYSEDALLIMRRICKDHGLCHMPFLVRTCLNATMEKLITPLALRLKASQ